MSAAGPALSPLPAAAPSEPAGAFAAPGAPAWVPPQSVETLPLAPDAGSAGWAGVIGSGSESLKSGGWMQ